MRVVFIIYLHLCLTLVEKSSGLRDIEAEKSPQFWKDIAAKELETAIRAQILNTNVAKNVIILLGDGMGVSTVTAGRIFKGQLRGESGEETKLVMEQFPHAALSKTYNTNKQVADSASTATAYLCGVKTNYKMLGVSGAAQYDDCQSSKGNEVDSVLVDFHKAGKSTGVVTTTRIQHATPGATFAHTPNRDWYGDADLTEEAKLNGCKDIAMQFYEASDMITVALGGGRKYMQPNVTRDPEYPSKLNGRRDGQDLIEMWKSKMTSDGFEPKYVWNKSQFDEVDAENTDRLLGLFEPKDMHYDAERSVDVAGEPSLAEMTEKAIEILRKNDNGYFLLVEGGRIDHGHHANSAYLSLNDVVAFDDAVEKAVEMTSQADTLIIVTADHSHVFTIGGKAARGNNLLGLAPSQSDPGIALDEMPYTTLLYANGPGYHGHHRSDGGYQIPVNIGNSTRRNLTNVDTTDPGYMQQSVVPLESETHGGEDVAIFAQGPMAHLFHGVHEQNYIAYVMRYASCIGSNQAHCSGGSQVNTIEYLGGTVSTSSAESILIAQFVCLILLSAIIVVLVLFVAKNWKMMTSNPRKETHSTSDNDVPLTRNV